MKEVNLGYFLKVFDRNGGERTDILLRVHQDINKFKMDRITKETSCPVNLKIDSHVNPPTRMQTPGGQEASCSCGHTPSLPTQAL